MSQNQNIRLHTEDELVDHKPKIGDKISGNVEQVVGKILNNPTKIIEGESKKTGHVITTLPDEQGDYSHTQGHKHNHEEKHSQKHIKESPHLSPSERSPAEGHTHASTEGAHHLHDSAHAADIPPSPSSTSPYVIDSTSPASTTAERATSHHATNIPLPPSHQNSFAAYTPTPAGDGGHVSSGYMAHGGLPPGGQGVSDVGLGEGGVADRGFFPPAAPGGN
ncbi:hypothetical protein I302_107075 [Kwoniella bestiolae CBS 10118]|uniref:Uncharacterized protein n=1 Tax=Kwoniella bestiolae CBS 10118 TaxID=1296100 RepID=A0A1B9FZL5_9TREE|nr:hypothetical protein I302_05660 [Kwoniella bestiolae CBS 10118]OCF24201.1 hypothetical protein I302_05660 [Kwoniella bestiolae CBS 10118]